MADKSSGGEQPSRQDKREAAGYHRNCLLTAMTAAADRAGAHILPSNSSNRPRVPRPRPSGTWGRVVIARRGPSRRALAHRRCRRGSAAISALPSMPPATTAAGAGAPSAYSANTDDCLTCSHSQRYLLGDVEGGAPSAKSATPHKTAAAATAVQRCETCAAAAAGLPPVISASPSSSPKEWSMV